MMSLWSLDVALKIKVTLATYVNVRDRGEVRPQQGPVVPVVKFRVM